MKNLKKKAVFVALFFISVLFVCVIPAQAAGGVSYKWISRSATIYKDMTGDNKKDAIKIKFLNADTNGAYSALQIDVNGKNALKVKTNRFYGARIRWFYMSQSKKFLQIVCTSDNDYIVFNRIYGYNTKTGKLVQALDLNLIAESGRYGADVTNVSSSAIQISYGLQPAETGWITWKFVYTCRNGKFVLKSNTASVKSTLAGIDHGDIYTEYFRKNQYVVANPLKFYTTISQNKTAFTAKRGDVLTLQKVKMVGKNVYLQFKKGNVSGWRKVGGYPYKASAGDMASSGWFYGVLNRLAG